MTSTARLGIDARAASPVADATDAQSEVSIRPLASAADFAACVALQLTTWGSQYRDCVPASLLKIGQRLGGVSAGAFDAEGEMLGFVYGLTGLREDRLIHWSHMLAVHPALRNHGIARLLKEHQRSVVRAAGVEMIYWTFDPLVARNGHLNLTRLGARVCEYVPDMYGDTGSDLHVYGTDRFIVRWPTAGPDVAAGLPPAAESAPVVTGLNDDAMQAASGTGPPLVRIEVPRDVDAVAAQSLSEARQWRAATRSAFAAWLGAGYAVVGFMREAGAGAGRCFYVLARDAAAADGLC